MTSTHAMTIHAFARALEDASLRCEIRTPDARYLEVRHEGGGHLHATLTNSDGDQIDTRRFTITETP